jgi:hypothetical protein
METGPIFIGGPDRCGKTTLRAFLVSHPRISIPAVGSNMWTYFYGQYGDLSQKDNFERCLQAMLQYKHVHLLRPDPERIRREFWQGVPTYARLFALFHQHYSEREGKPRWGDQTGLIERYADDILAAYPTAKILHMIRDPRDRYQASLALWPNGKGRAGGAVARWLYSVRLARRNQRCYPQSYKIVQFELLVRQPEQTLRQVCEFLNEEYVPTMLSMDGAPRRREKISQGREIQPGSTPLLEEFIGRYRGAISKQEIAFIQYFAGRQMVTLSYLLEPTHFSPVERLWYISVGWPLNWLRMTAWLSLEMVQHRLPSWFGRRPSSSMIIKDDGSNTSRPKYAQRT